MAVAYVRTVRTASGATAVQIVHAKRRGARRMEHVGSAHDEQELEALKTAAAQRLALLYPELDLGLDGLDGGDAAAGRRVRRLPWGRARCRFCPRGPGRCGTRLGAADDVLGFDRASGRG